jgi:hypothetical protein
MKTISGAEKKKTIVSEFLTGSSADCLVILSHDEVEDIAAADEAIRALVEPDFNCVFCVGNEPPIFITPRDGIATRTKLVLLMDNLPNGWEDKPNVVEFLGVHSVAETTT